MTLLLLHASPPLPALPEVFRHTPPTLPATKHCDPAFPSLYAPVIAATSRSASL
jgi:hypothetical protein